MKKILVLSLLILAVAATAYSQPKLDFRASGFISMTTYMYRWNYSNQVYGRTGFFDVAPSAIKPGGVDYDKTVSYVESRGRLKFDAIMGKELSGTIFFEMDSRTWGDDATGGAGQGSGRNQAGYWSGDRSGLEIKNFYFDAAIPYVPVPITLRAGLQPFGVRSNLNAYIDGTGLTAAVKLDPVTIIAMWAKALEGQVSTSDDVDLYALHVNAKVDTLTIGGYGIASAFRQYPMYTTSNSYAGNSTVNSMFGDVYWIGAYVDGKLGPVNLNFDAGYDWGKLEHRVQPVPDSKFSGYAARLKIDFPWEMFNFGVVGAYGSGSDTRKSSKEGKPGEAVADPNYAAAGVVSTKVNSWAVLPGSETGSFNESEVIFASYIGDGFTGPAYVGSGNTLNKGSIGGLWLAKLYGAYKVTPDFKVTLQGLYIGDTTKNGSTFGTARTTAGGLANGSTVGWEVDLINEWNIYKNLNFRFGGGYVWAGDALKMWNGAAGKNDRPKDPWIFATRIAYNF